jgi:hypothetical protein
VKKHPAKGKKRRNKEKGMGNIKEHLSLEELSPAMTTCLQIDGLSRATDTLLLKENMQDNQRRATYYALC